MTTKPTTVATTETTPTPLRAVPDRDAVTPAEAETPATVLPENVTLEHQEIKRFLRQRLPFLLVDRIVALNDKEATGVKNVTGTEGFLQGHFPDEPIMPGVLLLEAMSQVGGVLLAHDPRYAELKRGFLAAVDKVKFKKFIVPGDQIVMKATKTVTLKHLARVEVHAFVADAEVASGEISYYLT